MSTNDATANLKSSETMRGLMRWVERCNDVDASSHMPFVMQGTAVGTVPEDFVKLLTRDNTFQVATSSGASALQLDEELKTEPQRTEAVGKVMRQLREEGHIPGWRDELYPVVHSWRAEPLLLLERAAAPILGIKGYGVHINGFVHKEGQMWLWVAKRSRNKPSWPGKLDHIAAGGQGHGISLHDNVVKESHEEAGIPAELAQRARTVSAVSYCSRGANNIGLKRDVLFCFDLELPESFTPAPVDGEVEEFTLQPVHEVLRTVACTDEYKDNCNLVLIDFFLRHGFIAADSPGYLRLLNGLRKADCT